MGEEGEDLSPEGGEGPSAPAKTQDESPTGEEGEKPSSESTGGHPAPTIHERERRPFRVGGTGKAGDPGPRSQNHPTSGRRLSCTQSD